MEMQAQPSARFAASGERIMAIRLTCQCGAVLQVQDEAAGKMVGCPRCHAVMSASSVASDYPAPNLPGIPLQELEEPEEVVPAERSASRKTGRKEQRLAKGRRKGLEKLSFGLGFHYASPFVVLASVLAGCLAMAF